MNEKKQNTYKELWVLHKRMNVEKGESNSGRKTKKE